MALAQCQLLILDFEPYTKSENHGNFPASLAVAHCYDHVFCTYSTAFRATGRIRRPPIAHSHITAQ